jgi:5-methylcytosine-specific restriction protein A
MVDTFSTLAALSEQLNSKTDNLNVVITAFNENLARLNLGIEVWIDADPLERKNVRQENRGHLCWVADLTMLGYCRADDSWQLAVKNATRIEYTENGGIREELIEARIPQPLLRASRDIRLAAVEKLPRVMMELESRARMLLASINQAEEMAEQFAPAKLSGADVFRSALQKLFEDARNRGESILEVNAGELHRQVGGYPAPNHKMPVCCSVMRAAIADGDSIVAEPPSGRGASLTITYRIPR